MTAQSKDQNLSEQKTQPDTKIVLSLATGSFILGLGLSGLILRKSTIHRSSTSARLISPSARNPAAISNTSPSTAMSIVRTARPRIADSEWNSNKSCPGTGDVLFALKALVYGTVLSTSVFGLGVWGVSKWLGVGSIPEFHSLLRLKVTPQLQEFHGQLREKTRWLRIHDRIVDSSDNCDREIGEEEKGRKRKRKEGEEWNEWVSLWNLENSDEVNSKPDMQNTAPCESAT